MIFQWALQSLLRLRRLCAVTPSAWVMLELKIKRQVIVAFWQVVVVGGVFLGMSSYCLIVWFKSAARPDWLAGALLRNNAGTKTRHRAYFMSSSHSWLIIFQNVSTVPDLNSAKTTKPHSVRSKWTRLGSVDQQHFKHTPFTSSEWRWHAALQTNIFTPVSNRVWTTAV